MVKVVSGFTFNLGIFFANLQAEACQALSLPLIKNLHKVGDTPGMKCKVGEENKGGL